MGHQARTTSSGLRAIAGLLHFSAACEMQRANTYLLLRRPRSAQSQTTNVGPDAESGIRQDVAIGKHPVPIMGLEAWEISSIVPTILWRMKGVQPAEFLVVMPTLPPVQCFRAYVDIADQLFDDLAIVTKRRSTACTVPFHFSGAIRSRGLSGVAGVDAVGWSLCLVPCVSALAPRLLPSWLW